MLATLGIVFLLANSAFSWTNDLESYLDSISYYNLQVGAVTTDIYLYFGWLPDEKEAMKKASDEAVLRLEYIKEQIENLDTPKVGKDMKEIYLRALDKLQNIYNGVELKDLEEIEKEFEEFNDLFSQYSKVHSKLYQDQLKKEESEKEILPPSPQFKSKPDQENYDYALELMKEKKYEKAYDILQELDQKYSVDSPTRNFILLNISDCLLKAFYGSNEQISSLENPEEKGKDILEGIVNSDDYSPVLFDAFLRWRTLTQSLEYGMSNLSKIPNWEYNKKRKKLIEITKTYAKEHPDDTWARKQIKLLLSLPNISRGGLMGNSNLSFWASLYLDTE